MTTSTPDEPTLIDRLRAARAITYATVSDETYERNPVIEWDHEALEALLASTVQPDSSAGDLFQEIAIEIRERTHRPWDAVTDERFWFEQGLRIGRGQAPDLTSVAQREADHREALLRAARDREAAREQLRHAASAEAGAITLTKPQKLALEAIKGGAVGYDEALVRPKVIAADGRAWMHKAPSTSVFHRLLDASLIAVGLESITDGHRGRYRAVSLTARGEVSLEAAQAAGPKSASS